MGHATLGSAAESMAQHPPVV